MIELQFEKARSESVKGSSRASSSSHSSISRPEQTSDIANLFETSPPASRPVTPSVEASAVSRPTTPTLVLLSSSWTEPDQTELMGSVQSDLKVSQVAVQSDLKSSSCSPVRLEIFKLMGLMGSMVNFANFTYTI